VVLVCCFGWASAWVSLVLTLPVLVFLFPAGGCPPLVSSSFCCFLLELEDIHENKGIYLHLPVSRGRQLDTVHFIVLDLIEYRAQLLGQP